MIENLKVHLDQYPEMVFLMDIVVIDVPNVWGILLSRKFVSMMGGTLLMDLTYVTIPMDDETYAHLPHLPMEMDHIEEIDLDPKTKDPLEDIPGNFKEYPPYFFPHDLPFTDEEDFDDIFWPKRENYWKQLNMYKEKEVDYDTILKESDKELLIRPSQEDIVTA
jgi:hypothetical protein